MKEREREREKERKKEREKSKKKESEKGVIEVYYKGGVIEGIL